MKRHKQKNLLYILKMSTTPFDGRYEETFQGDAYKYAYFTNTDDYVAFLVENKHRLHDCETLEIYDVKASLDDLFLILSLCEQGGVPSDYLTEKGFNAFWKK